MQTFFHNDKKSKHSYNIILIEYIELENVYIFSEYNLNFGIFFLPLAYLSIYL